MIQAVSLFSGAGGLDLGLNRDKVELVSCLEIDKDCCWEVCSIQTISVGSK